MLELVAETKLHGNTIAGMEGISNAEIAGKLETLGSLLDLAGASPYTSRAYRRAAEMIRETKAPMVELVNGGSSTVYGGATVPGPLVVHSWSSYQCVARSASATFGSVCFA